MYAERHKVSLTTDASGDATGYTPVVTGRVLNVHLVQGAAALAAGGDITITSETTGASILTLTNQGGTNAAYYPRVLVHDATGAGRTYDGAVTVGEAFTLVAERVKIVIAQGGDTKSCDFHVVVG